MLVIKGFLIGMAKIIPGVSGAVLAISLGIYDKGIKAITNFFGDVKNNIRFLVPLGIGVGISFIVGSKIVMFLLNNYYNFTMFLFLGLIMGGIPSVYKNICRKRSGYIIFIFALISVLLLDTLSDNNIYVISNSYMDLLVFMISGLIDAFGTVIPGLSSTALLMLFGSYDIIMTAISEVNLFILTYYGIGMMVGLILVSYLMNYLFSKYKKKTYSLVLGLVIGSMIILFGRVIGNISNIYELMICLLLLCLGVYVGKKLD